MSNNSFWILLRKQRDKILQETDKTQLPDFPIETKKRVLYKEYRKYLREVPNLYSESNIRDFKVKSFEEWLEYRKSGNY